MTRSKRASTAARRDAGLRRLRTLNRVLIGTAVAGTGLLTDVAAHAFPGHKKVVAAPATGGARASTAARAHANRRRRHRVHHHAHPALRAPAHAPTTTQSAPTPAPAVTTSAPQPAAPAPAPAPTPAPVVSGGS